MIDELVDQALAEDLGSGDRTSQATVEPDARAAGTITQKQPGVVYGLDVAEEVFRRLDREVRAERLATEGAWRDGGPVLELEGRAQALLGAERVALNFLGHLSGVATLTARCVRAVRETGVAILDTRKTTPGMRALEKAAVRAGGGVNHRAGLYDALLVKENHAALGGGVRPAVRRALAAAGDLPVEAECSSPEDIEEALGAGATRLLLDNMTPDELRAAAARVGDRALLEASGGMTLDTLPDYARTGVHFISIGALTHSAPALDLSLRLRPLP